MLKNISLCASLATFLACVNPDGGFARAAEDCGDLISADCFDDRSSETRPFRADCREMQQAYHACLREKIDGRGDYRLALFRKELSKLNKMRRGEAVRLFRGRHIFTVGGANFSGSTSFFYAEKNSKPQHYFIRNPGDEIMIFIEDFDLKLTLKRMSEPNILGISTLFEFDVTVQPAESP